MLKLNHGRRIVFAAALTLALAACGGGGGDGGTPGAGNPPATGPLAGINDTGVGAQQCFAAGTNTFVACDSAPARALSTTQDGMVGRDAVAATNSNADGRRGFQFTRLPGGCIRDEVTGLVWESKTSDGGLRDAALRYTNYGDGRTGDASEFVAAVNQTLLCGAADWRLPSWDEMNTLRDFSVQVTVFEGGGLSVPPPIIDETWFPDAKPVYWSTDGRARPYVPMVFIDRGYNYPYNLESVRLVRGGYAKLGANRYRVSADGQEATDLQTNLTWRRCPEGTSFNGGACTGTPLKLGHEQSLQRAVSQSSGSVTWRLPSYNELASRGGPGYEPAIFPAAIPVPDYAPTEGSFWSSTPAYAGKAASDSALVGFYNSFPVMLWEASRAEAHLILLVRNGP